MHGVGRTVFSGNRIEEFQVEILGVLDNIGPKESLILARLSGGPLEHTGVMQGMSGSPVYIDGKLVGAVAMAFPSAKDPIAGIRPIEDMVRAAATGRRRRPAPPCRPSPWPIAISPARCPSPPLLWPAKRRMVDIATPHLLRRIQPGHSRRLRAATARAGTGAAPGHHRRRQIEPAMGNPADLKPGSMISVQLMSGDLSVGADGTVTYIDGNRIYAFGHRFLDVGATALPFARAEVITLLPNINTSFKLSAAKEWMGIISEDRNTAVAGELGKRAPMAPVTMSVSRGARPIETYQMQMVNDPLLSPLLLQMAVYSAIDATERTVGAASLRVTGQVEFQNAPAPIRARQHFRGR